MARDFTLQDQLAFSNGISESKDVVDILLRTIPGACNVHRAAHVNDRNGTDWWVEHASGKHLSIDAKVREVDWQKRHPDEDDLALETWSVCEKRIVGWTRNAEKRTDYILWLWVDTGRWCLLAFPMLCHVFTMKWMEWKERYKVRQQRTLPARGSISQPYHSECVFVPRREVWAEIYRTFGGSPIDSP